MFFCITPTFFTALNIFFTACPPFLEATYLLLGIFFYFLITSCFLIKFCTYVILNILLVYRLKTCMGVLSFAGGYFDFLFLWGWGWGQFLKNFGYIFGVTLRITQKIIWHVAFTLQGHFKTPFCPLYNPLCTEEPKIFSCFAQILWLLWWSLSERNYFGSQSTWVIWEWFLSILRHVPSRVGTHSISV